MHRARQLDSRCLHSTSHEYLHDVLVTAAQVQSAFDLVQADLLGPLLPQLRRRVELLVSRYARVGRAAQHA